MPPTLHIKLFGGFSLLRDDQPITSLNGRSQLLLAYLLLQRHTPQSRQRIAFHFWPESSDSQARNNLRKALSDLRRSLPEADARLSSDTKTLRWSTQLPFTLDVAEFEQAITTADQATDSTIKHASWEQAIQLYRGDLLPDYDHEWLVPERERLQQMQNRTLEQLVELLSKQHDYATALTYAQQLLRLDRLNEAAYCMLMRLYGQLGDRSSALQLYHQCMTVLREELGVDPSATTRKLYEQLLQDDAVTDDVAPETEAVDLRSHPQSSVESLAFFSPISSLSRGAAELWPLVGREAEWATIFQWAERLTNPAMNLAASNRVLSKTTEVLLLVGEPGIGKTRLLEELETLAQANQIKIVWGTGFAAEMMRPYGLWIDALRTVLMSSGAQLPPELGFLLPELGQPAQALTDPSHLFDAVVRSLLMWANPSPLLIMLDDIQWMDEASSALLHYAVRVLRSQPVWIACTARAGELAANTAVSRVLQALRREQRLQTLELAPLDREQTAELMRNTGAISPSALSLALANQVFMDSGGNPLFALEIARSLGTNFSSSTNTVEMLICDRIQQLDEAARDLLPWAAALGRSFEPMMVADVTGYPITQLLTAIEQLEQQGIIRPSTAPQRQLGYDFTHGIMRQVVYEQLSPPRRQLIHHQIAQKLHKRMAQDETIANDLAHHASLAGDHALAASAALAAAERCLKLFAYAEATEQAQRGIHHCQLLEPAVRLQLHAQLLKVCALAGITSDQATVLEGDAQQLIQEAQLLKLTVAEASALEALAILQFDHSNYQEIHQHSLRVAEVSRIADPVVAARMLAHSGSCLAEIGRDISRAEALLLEAQSLANRVGVEYCDISCGLGCVHRHYGDYEEARSQFQQAWQIAQTQQDHWRECICLIYLAMTELENGDPAAALPYCDAISVVATKIPGEGSEAATAVALAALANYQSGQANAEKALTQAVAILCQVDAKRILAYVLIGAAQVDLDNDQPQLAVERAKAALTNAKIVDHPSEIALSWVILIQGLLTLGDQTQAAAEFTAFQKTINLNHLHRIAQTAVEAIQQRLQTPIASTS